MVADFNCASMSVMLALGAISNSRRSRDQNIRSRSRPAGGGTVARVAVGAARHFLDHSGRGQLAQAVLDIGDVVAIAEAAQIADAARLRREHQLLQDDVLLTGEIVLPAGRAEHRARQNDRTLPMRRSVLARIPETPARARSAQRGCREESFSTFVFFLSLGMIAPTPGIVVRPLLIP